MHRLHLGAVVVGGTADAEPRAHRRGHGPALLGGRHGVLATADPAPLAGGEVLHHQLHVGGRDGAVGVDAHHPRRRHVLERGVERRRLRTAGCPPAARGGRPRRTPPPSSRVRSVEPPSTTTISSSRHVCASTESRHMLTERSSFSVGSTTLTCSRVAVPGATPPGRRRRSPSRSVLAPLAQQGRDGAQPDHQVAPRVLFSIVHGCPAHRASRLESPQNPLTWAHPVMPAGTRCRWEYPSMAWLCWSTQ